MTEAILATRNITKRFGAVPANEAVTLDLNPGEVHAIIGPNGAGKSTLIAQICGSLTPDEGSIELLGKDVTRLPTHKRAQLGLARTFQVSALVMEASVLQNAMLGALGASGNPWRFIKPVLSDKNLKDKAVNALATVGLDTYLDVRAGELSHGQRRQLEVGIALTLNPKAFVMDEPMAGLGVEGSKLLTAILAELKRQAPILLVEHDMDAVFALADRISVLVYGKVIATGTVEAIRNNPDVQNAYLGSDWENNT